MYNVDVRQCYLCLTYDKTKQKEENEMIGIVLAVKGGMFKDKVSGADVPWFKFVIKADKPEDTRTGTFWCHGDVIDEVSISPDLAELLDVHDYVGHKCDFVYEKQVGRRYDKLVDVKMLE